jgi:hypothetical protein
MTIIPKLKTKFGESVGVELFISPPDIANNPETFINTDYASGVSSFAVDNGLKFSTSQYCLVGNFGAEKTEIVFTHTSTAPTATTITLNSTTSFAHSRGDCIKFIGYNQVVIEYSTDSGTNYSVLATISIRPDSTETYYNHTAGLSTYYYRVRFKNSTDTTYSQYSDGIIATGFAENTAGAIIKAALDSLGESMDSEVLTKDFLFTALDEGRSEIDEHIEVQRWSFRTVFDYDAGDIIPGQHKIALPSDLRDPQTNKNILSLRIGKNDYEINYVDKRAINMQYQGVAHTTLNGNVADTDVTIVLTSSGDFDESGSIDVAASSVSGTVDNIDYTGNTESSATLTGVTGIATGGHTSGTDVWQHASFGFPTEYTVDNGYIIFSQPFDDDYAGENIWLDYYKKKTKLNSDTDTFDEPFPSIYIPWMKYKIKSRKNPSMNREEDDDYKSWVEKRESQVKKEYNGQDLRIKVNIPC